ncbi:helix-turn-helix domain-containing protein [Corynebacterium liangguodongii]|uniref:XRE family transcriptional regulator n=1 Tax=Corynebacterium liangguodongii TaxID=2079535 RepID=A0A2S0WCU0_9CORY|nr:helix-turn-helix transcriptional regulator [Corynebacterium liangguodongii]AWB83492.1 XRE family transcriptional regulator [Corynebacterium liangguodongii]PWC00419.1 XRE family transcriptional regulator [Corynebacterium liangguodongii]
MADILPQSHWASYGFVLSARLRALREMRGLSQRRLAELSGVSRSLISNLERNQYNSERSADPTLSTLYRIAHALHVPPLALLPASDEVVGSRCSEDAATVTEVRAVWPAGPEDTARFAEAYLSGGPATCPPQFQPGATHTG